MIRNGRFKFSVERAARPWIGRRHGRAAHATLLLQSLLGVFAVFALGNLGCQSQPAPTPTAPAVSQTDWSKMRGITPRNYLCGRATSPIVIDGKADEPAWAAAPWTADFVDIEGSRRPAPRFRTRAKMLWDDQYLYIHAELQEPHVWGTITRKNEVIFYDNDFEFFLNPAADNHNYYEYEMNALNTIWELTLDKPYRDNGPVHEGDNIPGLKSAVHINGTLNNPADTDKGWSVEVAIPWKGLARYRAGKGGPPADGDQWRMNFSRVEWLVDIIDGKYRKIPKEMRPEDNWIWSAQGVIDMHRPERWGYVQFCDSPAKATFHPDLTLPARDALMDVYYRQKEFHAKSNRYAGTTTELGMSASDFPDVEGPITIELTPSGYVASATIRSANGPSRTMHVREDSKLYE